MLTIKSVVKIDKCKHGKRKCLHSCVLIWMHFSAIIQDDCDRICICVFYIFLVAKNAGNHKSLESDTIRFCCCFETQSEERMRGMKDETNKQKKNIFKLNSEKWMLLINFAHKRQRRFDGESNDCLNGKMIIFCILFCCVLFCSVLFYSIPFYPSALPVRCALNIGTTIRFFVSDNSFDSMNGVPDT